MDRHICVSRNHGQSHQRLKFASAIPNHKRLNPDLPRPGADEQYRNSRFSSFFEKDGKPWFPNCKALAAARGAALRL
jgi:hypothetical protein